MTTFEKGVEYIRDGGPCPTCGEPTEHFRSGPRQWTVVRHLAPLGPGRQRRTVCEFSYQRVQEMAAR